MTDDPLERRLREAAASAPDPEEPRSLHVFLADVPRLTYRPRLASRSWPTRSALAGLIAIVVVVAVGTSVLLVGSRAPAPTASPARSALSTPRASVTPVGPSPTPIPTSASTIALPPTPSPALTSTWTPVALPAPDQAGFGGPSGGISALPGGGFLDFVRRGVDRTDVYVSSDGRHWSKTGEVTGLDAIGISGPVAYDGRVYVAMGSESGGTYYGMQSNGAAWVSPDLHRWTKAPRQDAFSGVVENSGVVAGPAGFVAIGYDRGGQSVRTSPDGLHWTTVRDERLFPNEQSEPTGLLPTTEGLLMVGRIGSEATAWTTADGRHWTLDRLASVESGLVLTGVARGNAGFVALASGGSAVEVTPRDVRMPVTPWVSTDGRSWHAGPPSAAMFGGGGSIVALPGGYVAAAAVGLKSESHLWTSTNGIDWVPVAGVDLTGIDQVSLVSDGAHALLIESGDAGQFVLVCDAVHD